MPHVLFSAYQQLKETIPYLPLGTFPTPVERLSGLEGSLRKGDLFIKRDDKSSDEYGGNKVRKLEFILAEAVAQKKKHTITFGYAGSNHSLAVAVFAKRLGLEPISLHIPQPNAAYVRKNLLLQEGLGTELHHYGNMASIYAGTILVFIKCFLKTGKLPYIIPPGGSNVLGMMGMVGAVLELQEQVDRGLVPEPDLLYVPLGSCGSAAGIALGTKALGWKTKIKAVRVSERKDSDLRTVRALFCGAARRLERLLPSFPAVELGEGDFEVYEGYLGDGYAHFTEEGMDAVKRLEESDGIKLDGTYSGKTMAALIDDAAEGKLENKVTLFWNTYNSVDFWDKIRGVDFQRLPRAYHAYFTDHDQPLEIPAGKEGA
jgi:1-aminocyclopropane-1-carboxylate deaminase/D-cysteine desulfhydrase-like pyridoxal-dependent ACC family enzyme